MDALRYIDQCSVLLFQIQIISFRLKNYDVNFRRRYILNFLLMRFYLFPINFKNSIRIPNSVFIRQTLVLLYDLSIFTIIINTYLL